jgi:alpha-L-arabinofuranosidase
VDEHYYVSPKWFWDNLARYDKYDRKGPQVYVGEYAAHDEGKRNTLRSAIAEAAYLTSLERNGDVVHLASYAPLFARRGHTQWTPDMIYFTGTEVYPSLNYSVQKLFMHHQGDEVLPATLDAGPADSRLTASIVRDRRSGDLIVKVVNGDDAPRALSIRLTGAAKLPPRAERIVFGGAPADTVNTDAIPSTVVPQTETVPLATDFTCETPANSLTILRISGR